MQHGPRISKQKPDEPAADRLTTKPNIRPPLLDPIFRFRPRLARRTSPASEWRWTIHPLREPLLRSLTISFGETFAMHLYSLGRTLPCAPVVVVRNIDRVYADRIIVGVRGPINSSRKIVWRFAGFLVWCRSRNQLYPRLPLID